MLFYPFLLGNIQICEEECTKKKKTGRTNQLYLYMIYFFSGNGNSKWAARRLAGLTHDRTIDIAGYLKDGRGPRNAGGYGRIGVVFPIYFGRAPWPVVSFLEGLAGDVTPGTYIFLICTCARSAGTTFKRLRKVIRFDAAWSVTMPDAYIPDSREPASKAAAELSCASERLVTIASQVVRREECADMVLFRPSGTCGIRSKAVTIDSSLFTIDPFRCTSCHNCINACPTGNITLNGHDIVFGPDCVLCLGCVNACPVFALEYGSLTTGHRRYMLDSLLFNLEEKKTTINSAH